MGSIDSKTLLLLHCDDLTDSGPNSISIENSGVAVSTAQSKFGGKSLYFGGSAKLKLPGSGFNFGTGDFTIDTWVYPQSISNDNFFFSGDSSGAFFFGRQGGNSTIGVGRANIAWDTVFSTALTLNAWNHLALVRKSGTFYVFVGGVLKGTAANSTSFTMSGGTVSIGAQGSNYYFKGYLDEFRVSNVARWTASFTPPDEPYSTPGPTTPGNFRQTAQDYFSIGLAWDAVECTGYRLYRGGTLLATLTGTAYTDTDVGPNGSYVYTLIAYNDEGDSDSATLTAKTTEGYAVRLVEITSATIDINPCEVNQKITITVMAEEAIKVLHPEVWYSGEIYSNEV